MVERELCAVERSGQIIIPIEYQYLEAGVLAHGIGEVDPGIGCYREAQTPVGGMRPVPLKAFRAIGRYMIIKGLAYFQLGIEIVHKRRDIRRTDLRALRIVIGELA